MVELAWRLLARIVSRPAIADAIIVRAKRTPYVHLPGFMERNWVFNPYHVNEQGDRYEREWRWLPSIRVHHILRADRADHPHDHPWESRTIILRGWYRERRVGKPTRVLRAGDTSPIRQGDFHHIEEVHPGTCTLFFTWQFLDDWGYLVDGAKVPYKRYLSEHPNLYGAA